jgi:hypothetical protein
VHSSLTLQFLILQAEFIVVPLMSIQLTPVGPEYVGLSITFAVSRPCDVRKSTSFLPLVSVEGLYHMLCLQFASRPHIKFEGFTVVMNDSVGMRSCSSVSYGGRYEQAICIGGFVDTTTTTLSGSEKLGSGRKL